MPNIRAQVTGKISTTRLRQHLNNAVKQTVSQAADIVVRDIQSGVRSRTDINNRPFQRLKAQTIKRKKRAGSRAPTRPLFDTGHMAGTASGSRAQGVYVSQRPKFGDLTATVIPPKTHPSLDGTEYTGTDLAKWHNTGSPPHLPQREWFGVSPRATRRIERLRRKLIGNAIARGL